MAIPSIDHRQIIDKISYYYNIVKGIHESPVSTNKIRKSLAAEKTFSKNLSSEVFIIKKLAEISKEISARMLVNKLAGKTITIKIKYSDFKMQTRSKTLPYYISSSDMILENAKLLLMQKKLQNSVRLVGISISNLNNENNSKPNGKSATVDFQLEFEF